MKNDGIQRREFLQGGLGAMVAAALVKISTVFPEATAAKQFANSNEIDEDFKPEVGELFSGFLILPTETPIPDFVKMPQKNIPIVCGLGAGRGGAEPTASGEKLQAAEELQRELDFEMPIWDKDFQEYRLQKPTLIRYPDGSVFHALVGIEQFDKKRESWLTVARIAAQPESPRPFPVWSDSQDTLEDAGADVGQLQKVDYLPTSGLMIQTLDGYVFHWIENKVLFTLTTEEGASYKEAQEILTALSG